MLQVVLQGVVVLQVQQVVQETSGELVVICLATSGTSGSTGPQSGSAGAAGASSYNNGTGQVVSGSTWFIAGDACAKVETYQRITSGT